MASLTSASLSFARASSKLSPQSTSMPLAGRTAGPSLVRLLAWTNGSRNLRITCAAKAETVEKVLEIVKKQLALPADKEVTGKTTFTELGADSLDTVEIVMGLEEEFDISVEEESSQNISTVQEAADLIDKLLEKKPAA